MKVLKCIILTTSLLSTFAGCRKAELPDFVTADEKNAMETHFEWAKGGIGIVSSAPHVYVVTKSNRNEIDWGEDGSAKEWIGRRASKPEIVVFFDGKVWSSRALPHDFDKNKCVVVSFDEKYIRFYDYASRTGGFYERHEEN